MTNICSVWAIDVAEDSKLDATVHAFDVSTKFFPPAEWLPPRLTLHVQDVQAPFPDKLLGKFDLVHYRLFLTLTAEKLGLMVENAVTLLGASTLVHTPSGESIDR
jgi:hypothetical protein